MGGKRILLVEDDMAIRQLLALILEQEKYSTVKASNGHEALDVLEKNKNHIDLILSDILMPDMDGFEFIKAVKSDPALKTIPFIFLSGKIDPQSRIMGLRLGADDYLVKPFNRDELTLKLKLLLEKSTTLKKSTLTGLSGNLKTMSMKEVLQVINITKRTGSLVVVSHSGVSGALYFRGGVLINAAIGDKWGEESAIKLICLPEGNFRFEPNSLDNVEAVVTHTNEELLKRCDYSQKHELPAEHDEHNSLIAVSKANGDLSAEERSVFQLVSLNPKITIKEIEQLLGKVSVNAISILINKGYLAESNNVPAPKKGEPELSEHHPDTIAETPLDSFLSKLKDYETKHDLYALHFGLVGSKGNIESFLINLMQGSSAKFEKVDFAADSLLTNLPNFRLVKLTIGEQVLYVHSLICLPNQQFLWDSLFNYTVGSVVLMDPDIAAEEQNFVQFTQRRNMKCVTYDMLGGKVALDFNKILSLMGALLS